MSQKSCFFIGHRETPEEIYPVLCAAVEEHIVRYGVTEFIVGRYGCFDGLAAKAVKTAKQTHPEVELTLLLPYHPAERPIPVPDGFDSTLLQEKRTTTINNAVTRGIKTTAKMYESSVEWLGEVPENWRIVPAKALFAQSKETRHETDVQLTASQKYGIISQEDYMEKQSYKIVLADKGLENWKHVEPNDFIISLRSFQGGLEISYIPGCITWHYIVLKPKVGVEPEYFKWLFKSPRYIQALQRTANFIRDGQDLRFSNFVQVPLPLIPMDEQKEIAEYLNKETARIDSIIADITEQIEKLKEYRQSVISEVVTGKVAVE